MAQYDAKKVACPYFCRFNGNRICCEGVGRGNTVNVVFESSRRMREYKERYCYDVKGCHDCMIYRMLDEKWKRKLGEP